MCIYFNFACLYGSKGFLVIALVLLFGMLKTAFSDTPYNSTASSILCYSESPYLCRKQLPPWFPPQNVGFLSISLSCSILRLKNKFILVRWYYLLFLKPFHILCTICSWHIFTTAFATQRKVFSQNYFFFDNCITSRKHINILCLFYVQGDQCFLQVPMLVE